MTTVNRKITLASRPVGLPRVSDFEMSYAQLPSPGAGEVLVRSLFLSLDPYMRGRMSDPDSANSSTRPPVAIGETMPGGAVALVMGSEDPEFRIGDAVEGMLGWQEYAVVLGRHLRKIRPGRAPLSAVLGVLGTPGLTAYFGLLEVCDPRRGETVVVSSASGAIGMVAGQLAKIRGCRVVGVVADSSVPTRWLLDELGFDAALGCTPGVSLCAELGDHCPDGIDVYFDNLGGATTDAVLRTMNTGARICVCAQSAQYDLESPVLGSLWLNQLIAKRARIQGFQVSDHAARFPEACRQLARWLDEGKLGYREEIAQGIAAAPQAFIGMLQGKSQGKQLVRLTEA